MDNRAEINNAWAKGYAAGKSGESRASNPHIGKSQELSKAWDNGWNEGSENLAR